MGIEPITYSCCINRLDSVASPSATGVRELAVRGASYGNAWQLVRVLAFGSVSTQCGPSPMTATGDRRKVAPTRRR